MAESHARLKTTGMHCGSCAMLVKMAVEDLPGVQDVKVDHVTGDTDVTFDSDILDPGSIARAIVGAGYGAEVVS